MKKTFDRLTVGDVFYRVHANSMEYSKETVKKVDQENLYYGYSESLGRLKTDKATYSAYRDERKQLMFTTETDAIRYCKAQMMKTLFGQIDDAKTAIQKVINFKSKHFELLTHEWTENQISKLEIIHKQL